MAFTSTGFQSPATKRVGLVPSVYDAIIKVGATDTPLLSMIGTTKVISTTHRWITDTYQPPKKNAQLEISDFGETPKSTKQETLNEAQIFTTNVMVSKTMQHTKTYGGNELTHAISLRGVEHKRDIEYALLGLGRESSGSTPKDKAKSSVFTAPKARKETTAGEMAGLFYYVAKGASSFTKGLRGNVMAFDASKNWTGDSTTLTMDMLHQLLQKIWDSGVTPQDVFLGAALKPAINSFATRQFGNEKSVNTALTTLDTDFGRVNFRLHRFLSAEYGLDDVLIAGDFKNMKHGLLISTMLEDVKTSKTAIQKRYYTESTLQVTNADAFAIGVGLKS